MDIAHAGAHQSIHPNSPRSCRDSRVVKPNCRFLFGMGQGTALETPGAGSEEAHNLWTRQEASKNYRRQG